MYLDDNTRIRDNIEVETRGTQYVVSIFPFKCLKKVGQP